MWWDRLGRIRWLRGRRSNCWVITRGTLCDYGVTVDASIIERVPILGASADGMDVGDEERGVDDECLHFIIIYVKKRE